MEPKLLLDVLLHAGRRRCHFGASGVNLCPVVPLEGQRGHLMGKRIAAFMSCEILIQIRTAGHWEAAQGLMI